MQKLVKIELSPFEPNLACVDDLVVSVKPPYSKEDVTLLVNPNVTDYKGSQKMPGAEFAQIMMAQGTEQTREIHLDFQQQNQQTIRVAGKSYEIRLMAIDKKPISGQEFFEFEFQVSETHAAPEGLLKEGSITYWCRHAHSDWWNNGNGYQFGPFKAGALESRTVKHPDRTVEVTVSGPLGEVFSTRKPMPQCSDKGLFVAITWKDDVVHFYLNGVEVHVVRPGD